MTLVLIYGALGALYLVVMPALVLIYLEQRWNFAGSWEKVLLFFLVFFFFPGLLLVGPFRNFRPAQRSIT